MRPLCPLLDLFLISLALCFLVSAAASSFSSSETLTPSTHYTRFFSTYSPHSWSHRRYTTIWPPSLPSHSSNFGNPNYPCRSADTKISGNSHESVQACQNQTLAAQFLPGRGGLHKSESLHVAGLVIWLLVLFYLLGTTASDYFSCTLEKLSEALSLSPAVAGVTLLAIGNGAPDVFSSVAAFASSDQSGSIGFSSVLGGTLFVTTVVSGSVALVAARVCTNAGTANNTLPRWSDPRPQSGHHYHLHSQDLQAELEHYLATSAYQAALAKFKRYASFIYKYAIELPLAVPRRLTIPVIEEERWSRPVAIASCFLAPLFVGGIYLFQTGIAQESVRVAVCVSGAMGILLGLLGLFTTENARPPSRCVWLWLAGGFVMSIVWFFIVADQLVGSLETLGSIFNISPAILGLTVLAWGNSIGDLVADLALACGGRDGVQIAISGCYAGPLFNTVFGLGLSLIVACAKAYPEPLVIADEDGSLFFIIGFLGVGVVWALLMMALKGMRLSRTYGVGLLLLYCGFLITVFCYAMGCMPWAGLGDSLNHSLNVLLCLL